MCYLLVRPKVAENHCMSPIIDYQSLAKIDIFSIWCSNIYFYKIPKVGACICDTNGYVQA